MYVGRIGKGHYAAFRHLLFCIRHLLCNMDAREMSQDNRTQDERPTQNRWDWKGALRRRFRWRTLRFEWGRWCFKTNYCGETLATGWEWENE